MQETNPETTRPDPHIAYRPHVGQSRQYVRDIILGVNDGLVSTLLLVAGVVGGGLAATQVLLTAVAGAVAGAVSMAAGEYLATQSQEEVFDREIALEQEHIRHFRNSEVAQLHGFFRDMGLHEEDIGPTVDAFSRDDTVLLNAMKVLEFGIVETERRRPVYAMVMAGLLFLLGALPPTLPFAFAGDASTGLMWASILTSVALFAVGVAKTTVTDGRRIVSGLQNLAIAGIGGVVAYGVGSLVGAVVG